MVVESTKLESAAASLVAVWTLVATAAAEDVICAVSPDAEVVSSLMLEEAGVEEFAAWELEGAADADAVDVFSLLLAVVAGVVVVGVADVGVADVGAAEVVGVGVAEVVGVVVGVVAGVEAGVESGVEVEGSLCWLETDEAAELSDPFDEAAACLTLRCIPSCPGLRCDILSASERCSGFDAEKPGWSVEEKKADSVPKALKRRRLDPGLA